jgi:hypothetical protein
VPVKNDDGGGGGDYNDDNNNCNNQRWQNMMDILKLSVMCIPSKRNIKECICKRGKFTSDYLMLF